MSRLEIPRDLDNKRRIRKEMLFAFLAFSLIILFSWIELQFFGVNSYLFLAVFNLNVILLLFVLFLVIRNGVKLALDRKKQVRGARLRTKLVLAFISLSLIPTILMFLVAVKFVQTSVDYWFKSKVDSSLNESLAVGRQFYQMVQKRLEQEGKFVIAEIRRRRFLWGGKKMNDFLARKAKEYDLQLIGVLRPDFKEQNWHAESTWVKNWPEIKHRVDWKGLKANPKYTSLFLTWEKSELLLGIVPVDKGKSGFLLLGTVLSKGLFTKLDQIVQGVREYQQLKILKQPLKSALYLLMALMTLLIIFGAMWFGFQLAKQISAPIQLLSMGTQKIAHGDLQVRLEEYADDELGLLVQSFNAMAEDLEQSQLRLSEANEDLAKQNLELTQRRRYMEAVLDNITSGVISLDKEDRINTVNRAAVDILGLEADQLIGKTISELMSGDYVRLLEEGIAGVKARSGSMTWQRQFELSIGNQKRKLLVNVVGLSLEAREMEIGTIVVFEDITELDKIQRMAAWREVARRIAHEIKNPLTPIKLSAQRLEKKFSPKITDGSFKECTRLIVRQVENLQQMVREFSSFAKLPEIAPELNDLCSLLNEVVALFRNSHAQITWTLQMPDDDLQFSFDRLALKRVFINLLTNAVEAMEDFKNTADQKQVQIRAWKNGKYVRIEVADTGPGFSFKEQQRMFEPYFSGKKGNTGLGLTIVKSIIDDHQGRIKVYANDPQGSKFVIDLPV